MQALHTPLCDMLSCKHPILLAGMGGVSRHALAAAVSRAGGFPVLGMVREPATRIRAEVKALREHISAPFAVNLIPAATDKAVLHAQVNACLQLKVPFIELFWDIDQDLIHHLKAEGVQVIHQIGNRHDAEQALEAGVDILIAQGCEAGGHIRGTTSTLALLADLTSQCPVPVVASGGIASGKGLAAALALGAQGVNLGTALLATDESNAHPHHKQRIVDAGTDDTIYTRCFYRNWHEPAPVRVLANRVTRWNHVESSTDTPVIIGQQDGQVVYLSSTDSPLADATGDIDAMAIYAGQGCGQITQVVPVQQRMTEILQEALNTLKLMERTLAIDAAAL
ncbi:MAG: nitronate monooxygenase [Spongiibacteraceae bacterium]